MAVAVPGPRLPGLLLQRALVPAQLVHLIERGSFGCSRLVPFLLQFRDLVQPGTGTGDPRGIGGAVRVPARAHGAMPRVAVIAGRWRGIRALRLRRRALAGPG